MDPRISAVPQAHPDERSSSCMERLPLRDLAVAQGVVFFASRGTFCRLGVLRARASATLWRGVSH